MWLGGEEGNVYCVSAFDGHIIHREAGAHKKQVRAMCVLNHVIWSVGLDGDIRRFSTDVVENPRTRRETLTSRNSAPLPRPPSISETDATKSRRSAGSLNDKDRKQRPRLGTVRKVLSPRRRRLPQVSDKEKRKSPFSRTRTDQRLRICDTSCPRPQYLSCCVVPSHGLVVTGDHRGNIVGWSEQGNNEFIVTLPQPILAMCSVSPSIIWLASGNYVFELDISCPSAVTNRVLPAEHDIRGLINLEERDEVWGCTSDCVYIWSVTSKREVVKLTPPLISPLRCLTVVRSGDEITVWCGGRGGYCVLDAYRRVVIDTVVVQEDVLCVLQSGENSVWTICREPDVAMHQWLI